METTEDLPFFGYGRFAEGDDLPIRVLGRRLEGAPARLEGYRIEQARGYSYLTEDEGQTVDGVLYTGMRPSDYWMLDEYQGLQQDFYRRRAVQVEAGSRRLDAFAYVVGPALSYEDTVSGTDTETK